MVFEHFLLTGSSSSCVAHERGGCLRKSSGNMSILPLDIPDGFLEKGMSFWNRAAGYEPHTQTQEEAGVDSIVFILNPMYITKQSLQN